MRLSRAFLAICVFSVAACGPGRGARSASHFSDSTGHFDAQGIDYTDGGDHRVREARRQEPPPPATATTKPFAVRLKEFEISRFHKDQNQPSQLGDDHAVIKVFFIDRNHVEFAFSLAKSGDAFKVESNKDGLRLSGSITDGDSETLGDFQLTDLKKNESAHMLYRAYKGKLDVHTDQSKVVAPGSNLDRQIRNLKDGAFAWVHNWVVVNGPSVYLVDIVNAGQSDLSKIPVFAFKGESKRTGDADHPATSLTDPRTDVRLVGNSEEESRRLFAIGVKEKPDQQPEEFMLEVEDVKPAATPKLSPEETPLENEPSPKTVATGYLRDNLGTPRSLKMSTDFQKNRDLPGVRKTIADFQRNGRRDLENFYTYANPFRPLIEAVGSAFDVSPSFAYLTVVESSYFTGGRYHIEGNSRSSALGPFQLLERTAQELKLKVTGGADDERRYFAPSACGAAKYIGRLVDGFPNGDATAAILAYYQGDGGAAAAVVCSFRPTGSPAACASQIGKGFSGQDYSRFKKLARNFNFSYAEMDRLAAIPAHMRAYVNKKLAVYFISQDMNRYGFKVGAGAPRTLPANGTVFPSASIQDERCRSAVAPFH